MPDSYRSIADAYMRLVRRSMARREATEMLYLSQKWAVAQKALAKEIQRLADAGLNTPYQILRSDEYKALLAQAKRQIAIFSDTTAKIITNEQMAYAKMGWVPKMAGVEMGSRRLPTQAILNMIGNTDDGAPLYSILVKNYGEFVDEARNILISSTTTGMNPRTTARLLTKVSNGPYWKSLRVARTEQISVFRNVTQENFKRFDIGQWEWLAQPDACDDCQAQDGTIHDVGESLESHPNCRCGMLPVLDNN